MLEDNCGKIYTILTHLAKKRHRVIKTSIKENWLNHFKRGVDAFEIL